MIIMAAKPGEKEPSLILHSISNSVIFTRANIAQKVTNWSASQLHMNFPNCRLKLQHYVVPALVETALNMGNAGVTAVTQIHRSLTLKPAIIINIIIIATIVTMIVTTIPMIVTTLNDNHHKGEQSQQPQSQQLTSITLSPSILRPPSLLLEGL